jgi:hypothetical protein
VLKILPVPTGIGKLHCSHSSRAVQQRFSL